MENLSMEDIIDLFQMKPHIEGGYYSTYHEDPLILPHTILTGYDEDKNCCNGIYFLIPGGGKSVLHQLPMNEIWHFCLGNPLELYQINSDKSTTKIVLGKNIKEGHKLLHVIPKGSWFGSKSAHMSGYSLVTCTTVPGFSMNDFRKGDQKELLSLFPSAKEIILQLTN